MTVRLSGIAYAKDRKIDDLIELNRLATSNNFPQKVILLELKKIKYKKGCLKNQMIVLKKED